MARPIKPQAENIPAADGSTDWVLRVGIDYVRNSDEPMVQLWIMQPDRINAPNNGSLILVAAEEIGGMNREQCDGCNQKFGDPRGLHLQSLATPVTTVFHSYPDSESRSIGVDTNQLRAVVQRYVNLILAVMAEL